MDKRKLQVFVSSTYEDLKIERQAAVQAVLEAGHIPAGMELFSAGDAEQFKIIKDWIDSSDVYMLILGGRYGSIEPLSGLSYTECEYQYALKTGKRIFSIVISEDLLTIKVKEVGLSAIERNFTEKYNKFKTLVLSKMCGLISTLPELEKETIKALADIEKDPSLLGWVRPKQFLNAEIGEVKQYFYPFLDPMKFKGGKVSRSLKKDNTWNPYILRETFPNKSKVRWVYGPYRTLPLKGIYDVIFRLRLDNKESILSSSDQDILILDVFDYYGGKVVYSDKVIKLIDLENEYNDFKLQFEYVDTTSSLEYRIGVLPVDSKVVISCDLIKVKRLEDGDV